MESPTPHARKSSKLWENPEKPRKTQVLATPPTFNDFSAGGGWCNDPVILEICVNMIIIIAAP